MEGGNFKYTPGGNKMKKIGIVICNYNKCKDVIACADSVLKSEFQEFDLYVVDNASTDGSVKALQKKYVNGEVTVFQNRENLGGSGGFNTGIRKLYQLGYEYIVCLDNDVILDKEAIGALYDFMENHIEVGIAGSKVYHTEAPEYIQQFGLNLDFDRYCAETLYADYYDNENVPEIIYCDTVATCSVMVRRQAIEKAGIMPEDNFIYWDDMEWGYRIGQSGYKVAACGKSKVWHKMGAMQSAKSSFINYYLWRNQIHFFMKFTPKEKIENMSIHVLQQVFDALYESMYRGQHNVMNTIRYAFDDALHLIRGKAEEHKILGADEEEHRLEKIAEKVKKIYIEENQYRDNAQYLKEMLVKINPAIIKTEKREEADTIFSMCDYVMKVTEPKENQIYIDSSMNVLENEEDLLLVKNYEFSKTLFIYMNQNMFLASVEKVRRSIKKNI